MDLRNISLGNPGHSNDSIIRNLLISSNEGKGRNKRVYNTLPWYGIRFAVGVLGG